MLWRSFVSFEERGMPHLGTWNSPARKHPTPQPRSELSLVARSARRRRMRPESPVGDLPVEGGGPLRSGPPAISRREPDTRPVATGHGRGAALRRRERSAS
jgi:hypothetical protein